jgi:hypothetical protein
LGRRGEESCSCLGLDSKWIAEQTELTILRARIVALASEDPSRREELKVSGEVLVEALAAGDRSDRIAAVRRLRSGISTLETTAPEAAALLRSIMRDVHR